MTTDMRPEEGIAGRFVKTAFDENNVLSKIEFTNGDDFNFAFDVMDALAEKTPNKNALIYVSRDKEERIFTFKEMKEYSNRTANYYKSIGIKKGDVVLLVLKRHYQYWFTMLALHKIGAIAVPATNILKASDYQYRIEAAGVKAVVCTSDDKIPDAMEEIDPENKLIKIIVNGDREGWKSFDKDIMECSTEFARPTGDEAVMAHDTMLMMFTSGTTQHPKMVEHNHLYPLGHYITAKYWHCVKDYGIHFTVSDTGWGKALWGKLYGQWMSETCIFVYDFDVFSADNIFKLIEKYKITTFCAPPTLYRILVKMDMSKYDLSSLTYCTTAGEALNPEVFYKFKEATGFTIFEGFGQTETTLTIGNLANTTPRPGSMGKASPLYDVRIMRADGTIAPANETGEIVINIENGEPDGLFVGYHGDDGRTEDVKRDGYYHTGDTAYMDEDGYFWFVGRVDDIIKVAGYRVGPFEIENEIMRIPYVLECAVTSVPDSTRGQAIKATIVLTEGTVGDENLKRELKRYFKENLASYKRPRVIEFVDEMPKTISGKVRRVEIKEKDWN
jgi:acetyl-CoA synthetase